MFFFNEEKKTRTDLEDPFEVFATRSVRRVQHLVPGRLLTTAAAALPTAAAGATLPDQSSVSRLSSEASTLDVRI